MKKEIKNVHIIQEHVINAPREKVFKSLTQEINSWWSHGVTDDPKSIRMDAKLGGHFYEEFKEGGGMLFGVVTWLKPGEEIELTGNMGCDGPVTGTYSFTLEEKGKSTLIKLEHKFFGLFSDEMEKGYTEGWEELLGTNLKEFVESGKKAR
jgi:uncharacterized protein YndB with AHSA1/START domain